MKYYNYSGKIIEFTDGEDAAYDFVELVDDEKLTMKEAIQEVDRMKENKDTDPDFIKTIDVFYKQWKRETEIIPYQESGADYNSYLIEREGIDVEKMQRAFLNLFSEEGDEDKSFVLFWENGKIVCYYDLPKEVLATKTNGRYPNKIVRASRNSVRHDLRISHVYSNKKGVYTENKYILSM